VRRLPLLRSSECASGLRARLLHFSGHGTFSQEWDSGVRVLCPTNEEKAGQYSGGYVGARSSVEE
jgi:hypothetical protein